MNWAEMKAKLLASNKALLDAVKAENRAFSEEEQKEFDNSLKEIEKCDNMIAAENSVGVIENQMQTVVAPVAPVAGADGTIENVTVRPYNTLAEQLVDIRNAASGNISKKLQEVQNALGLNEGVGSEGGFAVQDDFLGMILESAVKGSGILEKVDSYEVSGSANRISWMGVDEKDITASTAGGVVTYWLAEAAEAIKSMPKFKAAELKLEKLIGLCYVTDELEEDSNFIGTYLEREFTKSIRRELESTIIGGDGVGKPTGILTGGGLVSVAKVGSQTADTVVWKNITAMYNQATDPDSGGWAWIIHPDVQDQLDNLEQVVGTGGLPVYQAATMTGGPATLRGLPVLKNDSCSALGDKGDIILADLSDYILPTKGGVKTDVSMHVEFLTSQNAYRFTLRANGRPKTLNQLTIKNSSKKRGKYITLDARA
jgi:HK97 family phage major capsid protein